jgi:hypothetical protein
MVIAQRNPLSRGPAACPSKQIGMATIRSWSLGHRKPTKKRFGELDRSKNGETGTDFTASFSRLKN